MARVVTPLYASVTRPYTRATESWASAAVASAAADGARTISTSNLPNIYLYSLATYAYAGVRVPTYLHLHDHRAPHELV